MVTLRLFAQLREIAGTGRAEVDAPDVDAVLAEARRRFGDDFARCLESASIWVDGEPLDELADRSLRPGAEVALVPPVSGGCRGAEPTGGALSLIEPAGERRRRDAGPPAQQGVTG